jgi:demethylmenaquinone methyltransferase/2-methoxy-6-polyprenyl-1,4-benzoquinol methylase
MLTLISPKHLKTIIQLSGNAIRAFLSQAKAGEFKGEAHEAIISFQANPLDFSDEKLVSFGADTLEAINYPVRIEVRGQTNEGAAQMAAKGIWGPKRDQAAAQIARQCKELGLSLQLKLAGASSIEFNVDGVDKSLPIRFLQGAFEDVLKEMNYQPGAGIDSRQTKTVIAADGDSTIYEGPRVGFLPTLAESPVKDALCAYLQAGGIFMLVSGNDLNRSFKRLVDALPKEVYGRVLVAGNGGAELVYVDGQGGAVPVSGYRKEALSLQDKSHHHALDIVYIGDDDSREGNDYPAFKAVGPKRSILVSSLQGTRKYLEQFLSDRINGDGKTQHLVLPKSDSWKMFNAIAGRYDFLNRLLSLGQDIRWRKALKQFLPDTDKQTILDIATGTADVLIILTKDNPKVRRGCGVDMAVEMLEIGRKKIKLRHLDDRLVLLQGDAQALPFFDENFDCVTISFGIRNIPDLRLVLLEMYRVTKQGGRVLILEFSKPENPLLKCGHWLYLQTVVPLVGFLFSGNFKAYTYLNQTIQTFPYGDRFCKILKQMGFVNIKPHPLMGGIATIYAAQK